MKAILLVAAAALVLTTCLATLGSASSNEMLDIAPCAWYLESTDISSEPLVLICSTVHSGFAVSALLPSPLYGGAYNFYVLDAGNYSLFSEGRPFDCINANCMTPISAMNSASFNLTSIPVSSSSTSGNTNTNMYAELGDSDGKTVYFVFNNQDTSSQTLYDVILTVTQIAPYPTNFNALTDIPAFSSNGCGQFVLNQMNCGGCWTFSSSSMASDRLCSVGILQPPETLSMQTLLSCENWGIDSGCNGGEPILALDYMVRDGVPTCTANCTAGCLPFESGNCLEGNDTHHDGCMACPTQCVDSEPFDLNTLEETRQVTTVEMAADWMNAGSYVVPVPMLKMQDEIMRFGSITATFTVYDSFFTFWNGSVATGAVYVTATGAVAGGHAIKLVGWGTTDDGTEYWLGHNSWGQTGMAIDGVYGFFRYGRGNNLGGMESNAAVGYAPNAIPAEPAVVSRRAAASATKQTGGHLLPGGWYEHADLAGERNVARASGRVGFDVGAALRANGMKGASIVKVETQVVSGAARGRVTVRSALRGDCVLHADSVACF